MCLEWFVVPDLMGATNTETWLVTTSVLVFNGDHIQADDRADYLVWLENIGNCVIYRTGAPWGSRMRGMIIPAWADRSEGSDNGKIQENRRLFKICAFFK